MKTKGRISRDSSQKYLSPLADDRCNLDRPWIQPSRVQSNVDALRNRRPADRKKARKNCDSTRERTTGTRRALNTPTKGREPCRIPVIISSLTALRPLTTKAIALNFVYYCDFVSFFKNNFLYIFLLIYFSTRYCL